MLRAFNSHVWSPAGFPATLLNSPDLSGLTMGDAILFAAVLIRAVGILLQGVPSDCVRLALGAMGFPALSHWKRSRAVVGFPELKGLFIGPDDALKSQTPFAGSRMQPLKASIGVVFPNPGSTPSRSRVQSMLTKKKVLLWPL